MNDQAIDEQMAELMTTYVKEEVDNDEWDVAPRLWMLFTQNDERIMVADLAMPTEIWTIGSPVDTLHRFIEPHFVQIGPPPEDEVHKFLGLMFAVEGWGLEAKPTDTIEYVEEMKEASHNHTIHLRDDKVETKIISIVLRDSSSHGIMWNRGAAEPQYITSSREKENPKLEGRVFDILSRIVAAMTRKDA